MHQYGITLFLSLSLKHTRPSGLWFGSVTPIKSSKTHPRMSSSAIGRSGKTFAYPIASDNQSTNYWNNILNSEATKRRNEAQNRGKHKATHCTLEEDTNRKKTGAEAVCKNGERRKWGLSCCCCCCWSCCCRFEMSSTGVIIIVTNRIMGKRLLSFRRHPWSRVSPLLSLQRLNNRVIELRVVELHKECWNFHLVATAFFVVVLFGGSSADLWNLWRIFTFHCTVVYLSLVNGAPELLMIVPVARCNVMCLRVWGRVL